MGRWRIKRKIPQSSRDSKLEYVMGQTMKTRLKKKMWKVRKGLHPRLSSDFLHTGAVLTQILNVKSPYGK